MILRSTPPRWIVPETLQTSTTDCGPAALKSLLEGMGIRASYARLRAACQTDIDGTSIDGLEELCQSLGLEAEQMVVPRDHLLIGRAQLLPCIAVVKSRLGPHFVTTWNRVGPWVQTMDPSYGRRWQLAPAFLRTLMPFALPVDAAAWRGWAETDEYSGAIDERMAALGLGSTRRGALLRRALDDPGWRGVGVLDASIRFATQLMRSGGLRRGDEVLRFLDAVGDPARRGGAEIPDGYWSVRPAEPGPDGAEQLSLSGAVVLRARGAPSSAEAPAPDEEEPLEVAPGGDAEAPPAAEPTPGRPAPHALAGELLDAGAPSLRRRLIDLLRADGPREGALLLGLLAAGALGIVIELALFRTLIDLLARLGLASHRAQALGAVVVFTLALLLMEIPAMSLALRAGRRLELRLRLGFAERLPRLADGYLQSRQVSDLAGRIHYAARIRQLPDVLCQVFGAGWELVATAAAIAWLDPRLLPHLCAVVALGVLVPLLGYHLVRERDYRVRTLRGSMFRFYLDSLQGLFPVLTHGAERGVQSEHDQILNHWESAAGAHLRARMWAEGLQLLVGLGSAVWLVRAHLRHAEGGVGGGGVLLVVYLALNVPAIGQRLALLMRQLVLLRNHGFALLETLAEPAWRVAPDASEEALGPRGSAPRAGIEIELQDLTVLSGGKELLSSIDLTVRPGEHVAVVGPSGAGKSSLLGLFLGWVQPTRGELLLDGEPAGPAVLSRLAADIAWVDPATQLWNRPLLDNLGYAAPGRGVGAAIDAMDLRSVLERLPDGLQSPLGEGGRLLSGGEGQRVRLGRAYLQRDARLVLLDEAFRGLDLAIRQRLLRTTRARFRDATLLCVTHDIEEALAFDRVLVVDDGRIVEDGDPRILAQAAGSRYRALLSLEEELQAALGSPAWRQVLVSGGRVDLRGSAT